METDVWSNFLKMKKKKERNTSIHFQKHSSYEINNLKKQNHLIPICIHLLTCYGCHIFVFFFPHQNFISQQVGFIAFLRPPSKTKRE